MSRRGMTGDDLSAPLAHRPGTTCTPAGPTTCTQARPDDVHTGTRAPGTATAIVPIAARDAMP